MVLNEGLSLSNDDIEITDEGTEKCWRQWAELVALEGWTSDDHSVTGMTPHLDSTRIVLAKQRSTGNFLGAVIWNEYDGVAFLGFYIMVPELRGKGFGSVIWDRAMKRIPKDHALGLRAVPYMAPRYQSRDTPISSGLLIAYTFEWKTLHEIFQKCNPSTSHTVKKISALDENEMNQVFAFDQQVTKRDRSHFLKIFYGYEFTEGCVAFDAAGKVVAVAGITPTNVPADKFYKVAPIYAPTKELAAAVALPLIEWAADRDPAARCICHVIQGLRGEKELEHLFQEHAKPHVCGTTLWSRKYENPIDASMVFIAHNNSGHFDA